MPVTDDGAADIYALYATGKIALYTTAPTQTDPGVEVVGGTYVKQDVTMSQDPGDASLFVSDGALDWVGMPDCDVEAFGFWDAAETNLKHFHVLSAPVHFSAGDPAHLDAGDYTINVT